MGRRSHFVPPRRKRAVEADPTDDSAPAPLEEPSAEHQSGIHWVSKATAALQYFAKLLWLPDYTELFLEAVLVISDGVEAVLSSAADALIQPLLLQ